MTNVMKQQYGPALMIISIIFARIIIFANSDNFNHFMESLYQAFLYFLDAMKLFWTL